MSDFLIHLGKNHSPDRLLELLKRPYGKRPPDGKCFQFPWGTLAILEDIYAKKRNIHTFGEEVIGWVGDLVVDNIEAFISALRNQFDVWTHGSIKDVPSLEDDSICSRLNGAFALIRATAENLYVVTDLLGFVPIYMGKTDLELPVCFGTHSDLAARLTSSVFEPDLTSVAEFLNSGYCTFPYSMHRNVRQLEPGTVYRIGLSDGVSVSIEKSRYWSPPDELQGDVNEQGMKDEFAHLLQESVRKRCGTDKTGIMLSGGIDSRVVLALVPNEKECVCVSFSNRYNREVNTAKKVSRCYNRDWHWFQRQPEFLAENLESIVALVGCESDWVDAHNNGFIDQLSALGCDFFLTGYLFDMHYKAYYSTDKCLARKRSKTNNSYPTLPDLIDGISDFGQTNLTDEFLFCVQHRRRNRYQFVRSKTIRKDIYEWNKLYPFAHDSHSYWYATRRLIPMRMVASERSLLEFAFKCPIELKHKAIFNSIAKDICADCLHIPSANDGVRLGSGKVSRLYQRAVRCTADRLKHIGSRLRKNDMIQHSWHDYQGYWKESERLGELCEKYINDLHYFEGTLFKRDICPAMYEKKIEWKYGFRLLQLAVWMRALQTTCQFTF